MLLETQKSDLIESHSYLKAIFFFLTIFADFTQLNTQK